MKANAKEPKSGKRDLLNIILETSTNLINISPEGIDEEFNNVLKAIGAYANADRSYVFLFYDDGKKMSNTHEWCAEGIEQQIKHLQGMDVGDFPWLEKRIKNLEVFHISDVKRLPIEAEKEKEEFLNENIKSLVAVPIVSDRSVIGFLGFDSVLHKKTWPEDRIFLFKIVADIFANAITRKNMLLELKESESKYKTIFEYANDAILLTKDGVFADCNTKALKMFGCKREDIIGQSPARFSPAFQPDGSVSSEEAFKRIKSALDGKAQYFEWTHMRKDGRLLDTEVSLSRIKIDKKRYIHAIIRDVTERKNMEILLKKEKENLHSVLQKAPYGVLVADRKGRYTYMNPEFTAITGYTLNDIPTGRDFFYKAFTEKKIREEIKSLWKADINVKGVERNLEVKCKDGQVKNIHFRPTLLDDGGVVLMMSDTTEKKQAEELFKTLADNSPVGVFIIQDGIIKFANPHFEKVTGYEKGELLGKESMFLVMPEDRDFAKKRAVEMLKNEKILPYEIRVLAKEGKIVWILQSVISIRFKGRLAVLGNFVNITEKKLMEEKLRNMSIVDDLTQLYNRRGFFMLAEQQMKISKRNNKEMLFFFIDLDGLKSINDTHGHQEGDVALIGAAGILKETFRDTDIIGRIGGDEFAALAVGTSETTRGLLMKRLNEHIDSYNESPKGCYRMSMSVGISVYNPENPSTIDELMSVADTLMYENKKRKKC